MKRSTHRQSAWWSTCASARSRQARCARRRPPKPLALGHAAAWVAAAQFLSCSPAGVERSACDGLADRKMGIAAAEYAPCADELISTLDSLRVYLDLVVREDSSFVDPATRAYRRMRSLVAQTGIMRDYRSAPGIEVERWPEATVRAFNSAVTSAAVQYGSGLNAARRGLYEDARGNFNYASSLHDRAKRFRGQIP